MFKKRLKFLGFVCGIVAVVLSVIIFVLALIGLAVIGGAAALSGL